MYAAAIWIVVLGWIGAAPIMASSWNDLRTSSVTQLGNGKKVDITNNQGDQKWHLLSRTIDAKPGSYSVACTPKDKGVDTANYGYASMPETFGSRKNIGKGIGSVATFAAIILAGWTWWGRRTDRKLASLESS